MRKRSMLLLLLTCILLMPAVAQAEQTTSQSVIIDETCTTNQQTAENLEPENLVVVTESPVQTLDAAVQIDENLSEVEVYKILEEELKKALLEQKSELRISYPVGKTRLENINNYSPYFSNGISLSLCKSSTTNRYFSVMIRNSMTVEETREYFAKVDQEIEKVDQIFRDDMTEVEKALVLHDYIVSQCEYAEERYYSGTSLADDYRSGGMLMRKEGVCVAYANLYKYFLDRHGVECHVTTSGIMNHAWNIVKINGKYYHVDVTWDDPTSDTFGIPRHSYFLFADGEKSDHKGWDRTDLVCNSTAYSNFFWKNSHSPIIVERDYYYYVKNNGDRTGSLIRRNKTTGQETILKNVGGWKAVGNAVNWGSVCSGLAYHNGYLFYNTENEIRKMKTDGSGDVALYALSAADYNTSKLCGVRLKDGMLECARCKMPGAKPQEIISISVDAPARSVPFSDVSEGAWYYEPVKYVYEKGVMTGTSATTFAPDLTLDRAQFITVIYKLNGSPAVNYRYIFSDVPPSAWYKNAVIWANDNKIITGYSNGTFGAGDNITREQMALILYRYAKQQGYGVSESADFSGFSDNKKVSSYAQEAMMWAVGSGIITGKYGGTVLDPQGNATRAECATIMMRFMEKYKI